MCLFHMGKLCQTFWMETAFAANKWQKQLACMKELPEFKSGGVSFVSLHDYQSYPMSYFTKCISSWSFHAIWLIRIGNGKALREKLLSTQVWRTNHFVQYITGTWTFQGAPTMPWSSYADHGAHLPPTSNRCSHQVWELSHASFMPCSVLKPMKKKFKQSSSCFFIAQNNF